MEYREWLESGNQEREDTALGGLQLQRQSLSNLQIPGSSRNTNELDKFDFKTGPRPRREVYPQSDSKILLDQICDVLGKSAQKEQPEGEPPEQSQQITDQEMREIQSILEEDSQIV